MRNEWGVLLAYIADCLAETLHSDSLGSSKNGMVRGYHIVVESKCYEREEGSGRKMRFSLAYTMLHLANHNR